MKKLVLSLIAAASLSAALPASASVVTHLSETFASGATFSGNLTFADNYNGLLDVDGTLSGGGYGNVHFGWTWNAGTKLSLTTSHDTNAATIEDWLMDGDIVGSYVHYIGLSWTPNKGSLSLVLSPKTTAYYAGIDGSDAALTARVGAVPEPGSLALLGMGILAAGAWRRRRG